MKIFKREFIVLTLFLISELFFLNNFEKEIFILLSLMLIIGFSYYIKIAFKNEIEEIEKALERVKKGDYNARLDDISRSDLKDLSCSFNKMVNELDRFRVEKELKEKELIDFINSLPFGICEIDTEKRFIRCNEKLRNIFPYFKEEAFVTSLGIPELNVFVKESLEKEEISKITVEEFEKGRGRIFEVIFIPLLRKKYAICFNDVTLRENLNKMKRDMVVNISHELKTPISAISSLLDIIETSEEGKGVKEIVMKIRKHVDRMNLLLEDLFSLEMLESGSYKVEMEEIDLNELIKEIIVELEPIAMAKKINIEVKGEEKKLKSDRNLLNLILKNLISNAIRYNRENGYVNINWEDKGDNLVIVVEDTGEGIPSEFKERIFERFFKVDKSRSRKEGGTGLGLSIVKHSLEILNGDVEVESELNKGSKFKVILPIN